MNKPLNEPGFCEGDKCNRNGCAGMIESRSVEGCSCHISPPCSACTEPREFCGECDWEAADEPEPPAPVISDAEKAAWAKWCEENKPRTLADLDPTRIDYINRSHSNSSMIKEGVYPAGLQPGELMKAINGTFGGRFEYHNPPEAGKHGRFKFIAYTD